MKRHLIFCLLFFCAAPLFAQVGVLSVTNEDSHTKKEDFWHTFEYYVIAPSGQTSKCQATRVGKKWFATAAHCVQERCEQGCTLRMDLLEQPYSVFASAEHTKQKPLVFVHPQYNPQVPVAHDFALIKMDLDKASPRYYRRPQGKQTKNVAVSRAVFDGFLQKNPSARREFDRALRPQLPPILVFDEATRRIDRTLSVISIFDGKRAILHNPYPTDYVKELGFAYTRNFGVRQGMSGSGVMTNTGELAGIISAYLGISTGGEKAQEYFMFAVFNEDLTAFMESVMGSDYYKTDRKDAYPSYVTKTRADHREVINAVRALSKPKK